MADSRGRVVLLASGGDSTNIVYNALRARVSISVVVLERRLSGRQLLARRMRVIGRARAAGQLVFRAVVVPMLYLFARRRRAQLLGEFSLDISAIPEIAVRHVRSVNDVETVALLEALRPSVVVVNGTRIVARRVLEALPAAIFLNMHAGITPLYRGVHGAYWALAQDDPEHCGVTVHWLDAGIDTGPIVAQALVRPTRADSYATYPLLQLGAGLPLLLDAVDAALSGDLTVLPPPSGRSRLWSHPTIVDYVRHLPRTR